MLPDRVSNLGPLTYESGALPIALRGPAVSSEMLKELCFLYEGSSDILDIRDLCMILIGYSGFLRYDKLSKLKCWNVKIFDTFFSLHIESS